MIATEPPETPALILDQARVEQTASRLRRISDGAGCRLLYAVKAAALSDLLVWVGPHVDGYSASSPFEAQLVRDVCGWRGALHLTSPALGPDDIEVIGETVSHISFNSCNQLRRLASCLPASVRIGLRINPALSLVGDPRYDPCRPHSKLGASFADLRALMADRAVGRRPSGLLVHNNCESEDLAGLARTVERIRREAGDLLRELDWINLGGGYELAAEADAADLAAIVLPLTGEHGLEVFIEPGAAMARDGAELVARVVDLFESGGRTVAVLDTTVNHMPEAFEYQYEPDVSGHRDDARHPVILAGATCLAGDVFGDYAFDAPLRLGDRLVFPDMGAYGWVKAHRFNGINLPCVYARLRDGTLVKRASFSYHDFASLNGFHSRGSGADAIARERI